MSNPLKKTMVFLGLAEEDLEEQQAQAQQPAPAAQKNSGATSAAVTTEVSSQAKPAASRPAAQRAAVTPLRRVTPTKAPVSQPMNEILTMKPVVFEDAQLVGENFREGIPVILNLSNMTPEAGQRMIDFVSGLISGLHGKIERVTSKVFLLSPAHIEIGSDDPKQEDGGSFFVPPTA